VDTLQQRFGSLIRRRRLAIGLGQEALADKATLHRTHVSLLERGKRMPSLLVVQKLAKALDTTMASLMEELEKDAPADTEQGPQESSGRRPHSAQSASTRNEVVRPKAKASKKRSL
jgi:transcriptional regulator with XRE-family HTH domain